MLSTDDVRPGNFTITAADTAAAGDELTINSGVTVNSTGCSVTLNVGDNFFFQQNATVAAANGIVVNFDSGAADSGTGGVSFLEGTFTSSSVTINGGADDDFFGIEPASFLNTPVTIDGGGGALNRIEFDLTGVTNPELT